jgi:prevent-host-death family protein
MGWRWAMPERVPAHWQVQEAKQGFSEMLRAVENEGPQTITRHGEEVAVVVDIDEYRTSRPKRDLRDLLLGPPYLEDSTIDEVMADVEAERRNDFPREIDFGFDE